MHQITQPIPRATFRRGTNDVLQQIDLAKKTETPDITQEQRNEIALKMVVRMLETDNAGYRAIALFKFFRGNRHDIPFEDYKDEKRTIKAFDPKDNSYKSLPVGIFDSPGGIWQSRDILFPGRHKFNFTEFYYMLQLDTAFSTIQSINAGANLEWFPVMGNIFHPIRTFGMPQMNSRYTPLCYAMQTGNYFSALALIESGAKTDHPDIKELLEKETIPHRENFIQLFRQKKITL